MTKNFLQSIFQKLTSGRHGWTKCLMGGKGVIVETSNVKHTCTHGHINSAQKLSTSTPQKKNRGRGKQIENLGEGYAVHLFALEPFTLASKFFSHSAFLLEVARQLPLNTATTKTNRKAHLRSMFFFYSPVFSLFFFANVNAHSPLAGIIQVVDHMGRDLLGNHPGPATYCALVW